MNELIPQNNVDIELVRFTKYFNNISARGVMDAESKKSCISNIGSLFVDSLEELEQYNMPEFQVLELLSSKADTYTQRFSQLLQLFSSPILYKDLLFSLCQNYGSFISAVRHADIHFLYARKEEILQRINREVNLELLKISKIVPHDIAELMEKLVRNLSDPDYGSETNPDTSPIDPSDGGICLNPFSAEWEEVDSIERLHHYIDPEDYRVLSLKEL
jgi:hypothetical protein